MTDWNALISDVVAGNWKDPSTGKAAIVPFETIRIEETLDGGEADVLAPLKLGKRLAVVCDINTVEAMGRRVAKHLKGLGTVDEIVLPSTLECDEPTIALVQEKTRHADAIVAVGSGALSDTCKYATFKDGRKYATFGTAASMNGYAASTASVTLDNGYKTSLPAHAPRGIFLDLQGERRGAPLAVGRGPRRLAVPPDGAGRMVGLAPALRHLLFAACPTTLIGGRRARDDQDGRRPQDA